MAYKKPDVIYAHDICGEKVIRGKVLTANALLYLNGKRADMVPIAKVYWPYQTNNMAGWLRAAVQALANHKVNAAMAAIRAHEVTFVDRNDEELPGLIYAVNGGNGAQKGKDANENVFEYRFNRAFDSIGISGFIHVVIRSESHALDYHNRRKQIAKGNLTEDVIQSKYAPLTRNGVQIRDEEGNKIVEPDPKLVPFGQIYCQKGSWKLKLKPGFTEWLSDQLVGYLGLEDKPKDWVGVVDEGRLALLLSGKAGEDAQAHAVYFDWARNPNRLGINEPLRPRNFTAANIFKD